MAHAVVATVTTSPTLIAKVPAGGTVFVQNLGTVNVTLGLDQQVAVGEGVILGKAAAAGTPGGSLTTTPPGDPEPQTWWAVAASGSATVIAIVTAGTA